MTQEEKELLLRDLCARLPYGPFAMWRHKALNKFRDVKIMKVSTYGKNINDYHINVLCQPEPGEDYEASIVDIKPYLRPMSRMTEEEKIEATQFEINNLGPIGFNWNLLVSNSSELVNWLNKKMFDYRGLIPMGLALEAHKDMYNTKTE